MSGHTPMARYTLTIVTDTGFESTTEGQCTPHQYSMAIAALHDAPHTSQELQAHRDELLKALEEIASAGVGSIAPGIAEIAITAISKVTGQTK